MTINSRASGFRNILTCFSQIYECLDPSAANGVPVVRSSVGALETFLTNEPALDSKTRDHLRRVFTLFNDLVEEDPQTFRNNGYRHVKTFAPIELISVAVLISQHGLTRPRGMLLGDIRALREHLRSKHVDLRMNKVCWSSAWEFIDDLEGQRGTVDGTTSVKKTPRGRATKKTAIKAVAPPMSRPNPNVQSPVAVMSPSHAEGVVAPEVSDIPILAQSPSNQAGSRRGPLSLPVDDIKPDMDSLEANMDVHPSANVTSSDLPIGQEHEDARQGSSSPSAASAADSLLGGQAVPEPIIPLKRRPDLDLGSGSTGARALMAKKVKLMGK